MAQTSNDALEAALSDKDEDATATLVDWDGPNDAANPVNWSSRKRWTHILTVAILGLIPYVYSMESDISYPLLIQITIVQNDGYDHGCAWNQ